MILRDVEMFLDACEMKGLSANDGACDFSQTLLFAGKAYFSFRTRRNSASSDSMRSNA